MEAKFLPDSLGNSRGPNDRMDTCNFLYAVQFHNLILTHTYHIYYRSPNHFPRDDGICNGDAVTLVLLDGTHVNDVAVEDDLDVQRIHVDPYHCLTTYGA